MKRLITLSKNPPKARLLATSIGHKPSTDVLHVSVGIKLADPEGLQSFVDSVSNPASANYRHFLSPEEVGARFGLPLERVQKIQSYLKSQGMKVQLVAKNRMTILADATVAQAESAFHTTIEQFVRPVSNPSASTKPGETETLFSFTTSLSAPSDIAFDIVDISGLENFTRPIRRTALTPSQVRSVYSMTPLFGGGYQGQGRTLAISNFDGFKLSNVSEEIAAFGLPTPSGGATSNISVITINGGSQNTKENGEGDLDIQSMIAVAPLCNLLVYDGGNDDYVGVLTQEANDNKADLISESYGWGIDVSEGVSIHNIRLSMSAEGITYLAASGDTGTSIQSYNYPDIDPEVLIVGGTSLTINSGGQRVSEVGWYNSYGASGGGWVVTEDAFNIRPSWQYGTGVPAAGIVPYRMFPDVALNADPNSGYYVFIGNQEDVIGGTSGASPTTAAGLALCQQKLIADKFLTADTNGHYRFGRLQDLLYSYNGDHNVFYDITAGYNGLLPNGRESVATRGWDTVTGWGSMIFSGFVSKYEGLVR